MTGEEMERAIQFLIEHHARSSTNIDRVSADIEGLKDAQERTAANLASLAESVSRLEAKAEADRQEIREHINSLIVGNEVTRDLAQKVARLAIATSQ
jgi:predicted  nucleic acid-binding Zn-ribbon protein